MVLAAMIPLLLLVAGTAGYRSIEGWSFSDALYMTVITLTTVGYKEVGELSAAGRAFTIVLALGGVFTLFYAASALIGGIVGGEVRSYLGSRRMERSLAELENHVVVCGLGRMGKLVCQEFSARGVPFVVVDRETGIAWPRPCCGRPSWTSWSWPLEPNIWS
jgi:voltage-gated potassium channel